MFVKPAEGRAVRDPDSRALLAAEGEEKPDTRFWRRRVRDKDVLEAERPVEVEAEPKAKDVEPQPAEQAAAPAEEH